MRSLSSPVKNQTPRHIPVVYRSHLSWSCCISLVLLVTGLPFQQIFGHVWNQTQPFRVVCGVWTQPRDDGTETEVFHFSPSGSALCRYLSKNRLSYDPHALMMCDSGIIALFMHTRLAFEKDPSQPNQATFVKDPLVIVIRQTITLKEDVVSPFETMQRFSCSKQSNSSY